MGTIQNLVSKIRTAIKGIEVRDSIADGIEEINTKVDDTTQRQTNLETTLTVKADYAESQGDYAKTQGDTASNLNTQAQDLLNRWEGTTLDDIKNDILDLTAKTSDIMMEGFDTKTYDSSMNQLENCKGGSVEILSIKGETAVNLVPTFDKWDRADIGTISADNRTLTIVANGVTKTAECKNIKLKPSTVYTIIGTKTGTMNGDSYIDVIELDSGEVVVGDGGNLNGGSLSFTSRSNVDHCTFRVVIIHDSTTGINDFSDCMLLEGDWTNKEVKYFEGISGSIVHNIKILGKNLIDKNKFAQGNIDVTTGKIADPNAPNRIRYDGYIPVKPNAQYFYSGHSPIVTSWVPVYYDKYYNFLGHVNFTLPSPPNSAYMSIRSSADADVDMLKSLEVQLEEGSTTTEYTPYKEHTEYIAKEYKSYEDIVTEVIKGDFSEFNLCDNIFESGSLSTSTGAEIDDVDALRTVYYFRVKANKSYTIKFSDGTGITANLYNDDFSFDYFILGGSTSSEYSFTPNKSGLLRFACRTVANLSVFKTMLNEGLASQPYNQYQELLPIPIELYSINGVNDEIVNNSVIRRNKKVVLDGSLNWRIHENLIGSKTVKCPEISPNSLIALNSLMIKNGGSIIRLHTGVLADMTNDTYRQLEGDADLFICVSNADTGWADGYTPTQQEIKDFFNSNNYNLLYNTIEEFYTVEVLKDFNNNLKAFPGGYLMIDYEGAPPEVTATYAINIAAVRESMADMTKTNADQINNIWDAFYLITKEIQALQNQ